MDDFNFLHSSLVKEDSTTLFGSKNNFSKNYFAQITLIFVGKDNRKLLDKSLNIELKINWDLVHTQSLDVFCRLREANNYSIFVLDVKNKDINKEIEYLGEFKSKGHIYDLVLFEGDISVQNLASIVKKEKCKLLDSSLEKKSLKKLISKIVESRKKGLKELEELEERNQLISGYENKNKKERVLEGLYSGCIKDTLNKSLLDLMKITQSSFGERKV